MKLQINILLVLLTTIWGCAPMMSVPPAPPMPSDAKQEFGAGLMGGAVNTGGPHLEPLGNAQIWLRRKAGPQMKDETGVIVQTGWPSLVSGGVYTRRSMAASNEIRSINYQFEGGWIWAGASLPMAFKVGDRAWLTTQPGVRMSFMGLVQLPVGMSWQLNDTLRLDTEIGGRALGFNNQGLQTALWMTYGSVALSSAR